MFTLKGVTYKDILAIRELEIPAGQTTCIIGESGSGKSTLLRLLNHLYTCDEGEIHFRGEPLEEMDAVRLRRQVVMLSQTPAVFADTVKENLQAGLMFSEQPAASDERLAEVLKKVNLDKAFADKAEDLSGGEQQRLALARIMLMDPPVFLLDEPTSALDEGMEQEVMGRFFDEVRKHRKTVIMVTHATEMAERFSDRIINIEDYKM